MKDSFTVKQGALDRAKLFERVCREPILANGQKDTVDRRREICITVTVLELVSFTWHLVH